MNRRERIETALRIAFDPALLEIEDESARHAGHASARAGGETHYRVRIVSEQFRGLSRVARQRLVYAALATELEAGLHALSLSATAPGE